MTSTQLSTSKTPLLCIKKALLSPPVNRAKVIGVIGFEPTSENCKPTVNKELTENTYPVLDTSLDILLQKWPELKQIISAWPVLPEHIKTVIKAIVESTIKQNKK